MNMDPDVLNVTAQMIQMGIASDDMFDLPKQIPSSVPSEDEQPPTFPPRRGGVEEMEGRIQEFKAWYERNRQLSPVPAPRLSTADLLLVQARTRQFVAQEATKKFSEYVTYVGFERHSSETPVENLHRIPLNRMLVRNVHRGEFLLCRCISLPVSKGISGIRVVVQDPEGDAAYLGIYNFPTTMDSSVEQFDTVFRGGTILAIREPTYTAGFEGCHPSVRVDTPTDVIFVHPTHALLKKIRWKTREPQVLGSLLSPTSAESWKMQGNSLFKSQKWLPSAVAYSYGLKVNPNLVTLYLNRSEAYLRLGFFSGALHDAQCVLNAPAVEESHHIKALYRAARAEYGRGKFKEAEGLFKSCRTSNPDDKSLNDWIARSQRRLEETRGDYDWIDLINASQASMHLDIGDYQGPIEVRPLQGRGIGRGIVATQDVAVGDLLLVSSPFMSKFHEELRQNLVLWSIDLQHEELVERCQRAVCSYAAEKLYGNPDLHQHVFDLYAGPNFPLPPSTYPPAPFKDAICVDALNPSPDIHFTRLEAICRYNCFTPRPLHRLKTVPECPSTKAQPCALYLLPSLFNHSCAGNASIIWIGDVMVIRAMQQIKAGEEITLPYLEEGTYPQRVKQLRKRLPSGCDCWLCQEDLNDGEAALQRRHDLVVDVCPQHASTLSMIDIRALTSAVNATYSPLRGPVRPDLARIEHLAAMRLSHGSSVGLANLKRSIDADLQALTSMGFVVLDDPSGYTSRGSSLPDADLPIATISVPTASTFLESVYIMIGLSNNYLVIRERCKAIQWLRAAQWVVSMVVGGGKELFLFLAELLLRHYGLFDMAKEVL